MDVAEFAAAAGVTPRRVRALIAAGELDAERSGPRAWKLDDSQLQRARKSRRPLSEQSRHQLARAIHTRSLQGLTGNARARTAARMRMLRESPDPARLLVDWWGGERPSGIDGGSGLVRNAISGDRERVESVVRDRIPAYLRRPGDLAQAVHDERDIAGLSIEQLAQQAEVSPDFVRTVENARGYRDLPALRRLLRTLNITPTALPDPDAQGPRRDWRR